MAEKFDYKKMAFMNNAPRFWHTKNIATLASQSAAVKEDYIQGIVAFSIFLFSFFLFWFLFMLYFKVRGSKRYGCMAGQVTYKKEVESKEKSFRRYEYIQYVFILAIFGIFFGSALLLKKGVPFLAAAVTEIKVLNEDLQNTLFEGKTIATYTSEGIKAVKGPLAELGGYIDINEICSNRSAVDEYKIDSSISDIVDHMSGVQDFLERYEVEGLESNLDIMFDRSKTFDQALDLYTENDWVVKIFTMIVGVLSFYFLTYTLSGWYNLGNPAAKAMTSYFVQPLFVIMIVIGWMLTIFFAVGSVMNSDFCVGDGIIGPEATIEEALLQYGIHEDHLMFQSFLYYKSDCTIENPWDSEVIVQLTSIQSSIATTSHLLTNEDDIKNACGDSIDAFMENIDSLKRNLQKQNQGFERGLDILRCSKVLPMYRRVFHGASCEESLKGLIWSFFALLAMAMCGILMISFRSALYQIKTISNTEMRDDMDYKDDDLIDWEEFSKYQTYTGSSSVDSDKYQIEKKDSGGTRLTFTASDEEHGVEVRCFKVEEGFPLSPTSRSNQSSIDTDEYFNDDGVNSFNSELEPLTPSPKAVSKSVGDGQRAPVAFHFNEKKSLSRTSAHAITNATETPPGKSIPKGRFEF